MGPDATAYAATGRVPEPDVKIASPRGVYRCRDGRWVSMSGSTDTMARRVFDAIGHGALFDDPRYSTNSARLANDAQIERIAADDGSGDDGTVMHNVTPRLERTPGGLGRPAPRRGEHSAQVLAEVGDDRGAVDELVRAGVVECG